MKYKALFQEIKDDYFNTHLKEDIKSTFPEIKMIDLSLGEYYNVSLLYSYMLENIFIEIRLLNVIAFINKALSIGKHETEDVFVIEIFNEAYRHNHLKDLFFKHLKGDALRIFIKQQEFFEEE